MMKRFLTTVAGSFVGVMLGLMTFSALSVIMSFAFVGAMSTFGESKTSIEKNSILRISMSGDISERGSEDDFDVYSLINGDVQTKSSLLSILRAIKEASKNDKINIIYLKCNGLNGGISTLYEIRSALNEFKKSGGKIYAYGNDGYGQGDYFVASVADSIFLNPVGSVDIHGLSSVTPYFKTLLDKVGVEMQIIRVGTFKSAVEPYMLSEMSEANRLQQEHYLGSLWKTISGDIAKSRKLPVAKVNELADSLIVFEKAESYLKSHLVDGLCYEFEMEKKLKNAVGIDEDEDLKFVTAGDVESTISEKSSKNKIAVFYAEGEIDGSDKGGIDSKSLSEDILDAADDDEVKAVVLRVNSPGGSAFGSEQIWKALEEVKKNKKPLVVSMGDYAASGGYYISCGADRIFAEPVTITGSIGIFGMVPCFEKLATEKLGVNFNEVKTNANGSMTIYKKLTPVQLAKMQNMVNVGYELFTSRCATGRKMNIDSLKKIAEGRVWDGTTAKSLGLVDEFGNLESALKWAAEKAKLSDYEVVAYPELEDQFMKYLSKFMDMRFQSMLKENTGELYEYHDILKRVLGRDNLQCLMEPVEIR